LWHVDRFTFGAIERCVDKTRRQNCEGFAGTSREAGCSGTSNAADYRSARRTNR
jgi:hypothetical protein